MSVCTSRWSALRCGKSSGIYVHLAGETMKRAFARQLLANVGLSPTNGEGHEHPAIFLVRGGRLPLIEQTTGTGKAVVPSNRPGKENALINGI